MFDLRIEPPISPPNPSREPYFCNCGNIALFFGNLKEDVLCAACMRELAESKFSDATLDEKAEWAGYERIL